MRRVLVTGANGFIGSHLVDELIRRGNCEVHGLVRETSDLRWLRDKPVTLHYGDITDYQSLVRAAEGIECIIHSAAKIKAKNYHEFYEFNAQGTKLMLEAALACSVCRKFILISTQAASSPSRRYCCMTEHDESFPISAYGRSKRASEQIAYSYRNRLDLIILRPVAVYGPRDREALKIIRLVGSGLFVQPGLKPTRISVVHVGDLVRICADAVTVKVPSGTTYYVSDGRQYDMRDLLTTVARILKRRFVHVSIPRGLALFCGVLVESLRILPFSPEFVSLDKIRELSESWICSIDRARADFGFKPEYPLETGMAETIRWYRDNDWL